MGLHELNKCRHVAPKPETIEDPKSETIEDVREHTMRVDDRIVRSGGKDLRGICIRQLVDRAYECGRRDGMDANGTASIGNGTCPDGGAKPL